LSLPRGDRHCHQDDGPPSLSNADGNKNVGNLLDNVSVTAVPEPSTWAIMILGFAGVG
jgi:hypothetical protein